MIDLRPAAATVRQDIADWLRATARPSRPPLDRAARAVLKLLRRDGFAVIPGYWPRSAAFGLRDELLSYLEPAHDRELENGAYVRFWDGRATDQGVRRIYHVDGIVETLRQFRHDPTALALAQAYYGIPFYSGVLVYQHNLPSNHHTREYHVDIFDKEFKTFLYLDDVTDENGPFTYLRGTHKSYFARVRRQIDQRTGVKHTTFEEKDLGRLTRREVRVCAPAGTLILADVRGIHRGSPQVTGSRSVLVNYMYRHPGDVRLDR